MVNHWGRPLKKAAAGRLDAKAAKPRKTAPTSQSRKVAKPALLAGGNPQIAKADGDAPVQAYIAAMPGWKRDVGRRLNALVVRTVPGVRKAVKWNSPLYRAAGSLATLPSRIVLPLASTTHTLEHSNDTSIPA